MPKAAVCKIEWLLSNDWGDDLTKIETSLAKLCKQEAPAIAEIVEVTDGAFPLVSESKVKQTGECICSATHAMIKIVPA